MVSDARRAANRQNAQFSTGPRTPEGKARSSRNAVRHGLDAASPVIPGLEDPAAWDAHLRATLANLAPSGRVERALAERVALLLWRLGRVARFEREVTVLGHERAPDDRLAADVEATPVGEFLPDDPRPDLAAARTRFRAFLHFGTLSPDAHLTGRFAWAILEPILALLPTFNVRSIDAPEMIPPDAYVDTFPDWTAGRLRGLIRAIEDANGRPPNSLAPKVLADARNAYAEGTVGVRAFNRRARDLHRERIIPQPVQLDRVIRYETHLTRQLSQTLGHLRQLQQARPAAEPAPPTPLPSEEAGLG